MGKTSVLVGLVGISLAAVLQFDGLGRLHAQQRSSLAPTMLEAFAARPDARTTWSKFIRRLDGPRAYALVSAVALESGAAAPERMRGVRIELRHEGLRESCNLIYTEWSVMCDRELATVFIEEGRLEDLKALVLKGQAEVHRGHPMGITHYEMQERGTTIASGLVLFGYELKGRTLDDFATTLDAAIAELKNAPG